MTKIIMHGCNGKMGHVISDLVMQDPNIRIVAGIDVNTQSFFDYPVYSDIFDCPIQADVIIDFSTAKAILPLLNYSKAKNIPVVLCTTGLSQAQIEMIHKSSQEVGILYSANMSLGVNLLLNLVKKAASVLSEANFNIEIVEKHHNQKIDAPSGTALAFAYSINNALNNTYHYTYDRTQERKKRDTKEIGIHAIRGGTIVGEHSILFAGKDEVIELKHSAMSKEIFAVGAIKAAKFMRSKPSGLYDMQDVIDQD